MQRSRILISIVVLLGLIVAVWLIARPAAESREPRPAPTVPVSVSPVVRQNVPHWVTALGTVQSINSVVIRPQVDGVLIEVLFTEGDRVTKGEVLARIDDRAATAALASARAERLRSEAELAAARVDLERYTDVVAQGAISKQTLDQQQALVKQLDARVRAAAAAMDAAAVNVEYTEIRSPINGRTGIRRVDAGNVVRQSDAEGIVSIAQLKPIHAVFALPQDLLGRVRDLVTEADAPPVTAYERVGGSVLGEGRLVMLDNTVDADTGTIRVKAEFPNDAETLWPGQFVALRVPTGVSTDALVVPSRAVQRGLEFSYVFRIVGDQAEVVGVDVGYEDDERAVVNAREGATLVEGDRVVVDGQSRLQPGTRVRLMAAESSAP